MQRYLFILRWLTAVAVLIMLLLLAWQCIDIYVEGNSSEKLDVNGVHLVDVFRMEDVSRRLGLIVLPLLGCAMLIVFTTLLHVVYSDPVKKHHSITPDNQLRLLKTRIAELPEDAAREERMRLKIQMAAGVLLVICVTLCIIYLCKREHFTSWDLESVMGNMMFHITPWIGIGFAVAIIAAEFCKSSIQREVIILKEVPHDNCPGASNQKGSQVNVLRALLFAVAIVFIVLGVMNGGLHDVLVKAVNICTECIGLG